MKIVILTLTFASLVGCAAPTINELRQQEPRKILYSKNASKVVADCIQREWQKLAVFGGKTGATQEFSNGVYTVTTVASEYFVDIKEKASGSEVRYYSPTFRWIYREHLSALQRCL